MINRRDAMKICVGAVAPKAVSPLLAGDEPAQPIWKTAIGLNGFMSSARKYGKTYPIWEVLDYAARAGFDGVELVQGWPMGNYPTSDESQRITALRRLYDNYGLQVFSLQAGGGGAFSADAGARNQFLPRARDQIAFAKAVGCECIGLWPSGPLRGQTIDQAIEHGFVRSRHRDLIVVASDPVELLDRLIEHEPPAGLTRWMNLDQT